jgi:uracil-DNA glycosylase
MERKELTSAAPFVPEAKTLPVLREAIENCKGCDLYRFAEHAVLGEGPQRASVIMIGEQPDDEEDRAGRPFVGPAGRLLDGALRDAQIDRSAVYITNAVKHFKFEERGKGGCTRSRTPWRYAPAGRGWRPRCR